MEDNTQPQSPSEQVKNTNPMLIIGIIVVVTVIIGAFWLTNNSSKTTKNTEMTKSKETTTAPIESGPTEVVMENSSEDSMMANVIEVEGGNFYFKPNEIKVKKGEKVTIKLANKGGIHDFIIDEFNIKSEVIQGGASTKVEFTPAKAGTFEFYCSVGNHRQMGMKGSLIVE